MQGYGQGAGRIPVQAMYGAREPMPRSKSLGVLAHACDHGVLVAGVGRRRDREQPGWLVDDEERLVLVEKRQGEPGAG